MKRLLKAVCHQDVVQIWYNYYKYFDFSLLNNINKSTIFLNYETKLYLIVFVVKYEKYVVKI